MKKVLLFSIIALSFSCRKKADYTCTCESENAGYYTKESYTIDKATQEEAENRCGVSANYYNSSTDYKTCTVSKR